MQVILQCSYTMECLFHKENSEKCVFSPMDAFPGTAQSVKPIGVFKSNWKFYHTLQ